MVRIFKKIRITNTITGYELSRKFVKVYQTILFIPYFISWMVAGSGLFSIDRRVLPGSMHQLYREKNQPGKFTFLRSIDYESSKNNSVKACIHDG
ncbi:hypothetical protein GCM10008018_21310 [Paenibacillus marchantiophytorum]|uniref:Uncharacterized protein n=1 Tax=Paenibacillus marchantiophytorum TaxID=1619310 RepID=A0ABQ1EKF7_9BACL|nr:hypothetical protein GCM10008018_21310 [Paenibacillus marchantiophytorum]